MNKSYSELIQFPTFKERFDYLKLDGHIGRMTFGYDRYLNQGFYMSHEWKTVRRDVIYRDEGCDLGLPGFEIFSDLLIHHINPMTVDDIVQHSDWILNPEYLITTTKKTHNAIHFASDRMLPEIVTTRTPGDTNLW